MSNENTRHVLQAIEHYKQGLACVKPETGDRLWALISKDLASLYHQYATLLQDRPPLTLLSKDQVQTNCFLFFRNLFYYGNMTKTNYYK